MGKKRKSSGRRNEEPTGPNLDVGSSRKRIRDFEDVADSDDEFHLNRDKVLLDEEPEVKRRRKWQEQEEFLEPSDEEVLDYSDEEEDEDDIPSHFPGNNIPSDSEDASGGVEEGDEDEVGWGMSRGDVYGADDIETEEQALEEEKEALRLQKKQLQSMTAADYGFDESEWQDGDDKDGDDRDTAKVITEVLPQLQINKDMSAAERLKFLKARYPEFDPLSKELLSLTDAHAELVKWSDDKKAHASPEDHPNLITKLRASAAYVGALTMYFTLLASPAFSGHEDAIAMPSAQLRDHPVMDTLVKCRELWLRAQALPEDPIRRTNAPANASYTNGILSEEHLKSQSRLKKGRPAQKSRAQRHAEAAEAEAQKRRTKRMQRTEADLADLDALMVPTKAKKSTTSRNREVDQAADSDFGEEAPLTAHEAAEKAKRKKSLRFYTSQIAQKANKRGAAGRNAGGDDDIPYRERLRDRQARLNAEAERRGQHNASTKANLGGESDDEDVRQAREIRDKGDNEYYDLIASRTARKKADKAGLAEAQKQAALQGGQVRQEQVVGPDGKRKITYAIEKNKGLTPHRKKEVRNPRVKKRKKFDEKKKKLGSIKPVYKGGEGRGGYGGELTGIKKGLVKSTKL